MIRLATIVAVCMVSAFLWWGAIMLLLAILRVLS